MKTLLIVGNDKIAGLALKSINITSEDLCIAVDRSTNFSRLLKLLWRGVLSFHLVLLMIISELSRKGSSPKKRLIEVKSNNDLMDLIDSWKPERVVLFRAGLIINKRVINTKLPIMNVHCATVPDYGGLGSIYRALSDKKFDQFACLHIVTSTIDNGEVVDQEAYSLDPEKSYFTNENFAYTAGIRLLKRTVEKII